MDLKISLGQKQPTSLDTETKNGHLMSLSGELQETSSQELRSEPSLKLSRSKHQETTMHTVSTELEKWNLHLCTLAPYFAIFTQVELS